MSTFQATKFEDLEFTCAISFLDDMGVRSPQMEDEVANGYATKCGDEFVIEMNLPTWQRSYSRTKVIGGRHDIELAFFSLVNRGKRDSNYVLALAATIDQSQISDTIHGVGSKTKTIDIPVSVRGVNTPSGSKHVFECVLTLAKVEHSYVAERIRLTVTAEYAREWYRYMCRWIGQVTHEPLCHND